MDTYRVGAENRSAAMAVLRWCCIVLAAIAAGCYPALDWREVTSKDGGFSVLLPARAHDASRQLSGVVGHPAMHLLSASAAGAIFGVGYVDLSDSEQIPPAVAALRDGLVRNIQGTIVSEQNLMNGAIAGLEFTAKGSTGEAQMALKARLLVSGARIYQLAVIQRAGTVSTADVEMFFESFGLRQRGQ